MPKERRNGKVVYVKIKTKDRMLPMIVTQPQKSNNPLANKRTPATEEEAMMRVNASNYNKSWEYQQNCQRVVWAYEMQRRGYDVEALPTYKGDDLPRSGNWKGIIKSGGEEAYVGQKWGQTNSIKTEIGNITNQMEQWGDGSRAIVRVVWKGGRSGHVFNIENKNGKIFAYEAQSGHVYKNLKDVLGRAERGCTSLVRSDNVVFDESQVSKYVKTRGE